LTGEMADLIKRLNRQAEMYEEIDAGTGFGWEQDALNIREAIYILKKFDKAWSKMENGIRVRCESPEVYKTVSRLAMLLSIEGNLLGDMRNIMSEIYGMETGEDKGGDNANGNM